MSEITQPPPDLHTQDTNRRVDSVSAASDQNKSSQNQSADQQQGKAPQEHDVEKNQSHHDPAVTLASTLSKLDSGSHITAEVQGDDGEGRTIINTEVGTYLVSTQEQNLDKFKAEEFQKIHKEDIVEIRILSIDKDIKGEIIRPITEPDGLVRQIAIPVELTLTELSNQAAISAPKINPDNILPSPIEDIKSQYQATTLYKAETIAREIGEKLDNLPLPTTAPNYTVFSTPPENSQTNNQTINQISPNILIQEINPSSENKTTPSPISSQNSIAQFLNQNVDVQVIKALPREVIPLPPGLPAAVVKEITALTPLDYVQKGQNLKINVSAVAIPEITKETTSQQQSQTKLASQTQSFSGPAQSTSNITQPQTTPTENVKSPTDKAVNPEPTNTNNVAIKDAVISGIIIDASKNTVNTTSDLNELQKNIDKNPINPGNAYQQTSNINQQKSANNTPEKKTYYLATPTAVLKFETPTQLTAGTVVSFTVGENFTKTVDKQDSIPLTSSEQNPQSPASPTVTQTTEPQNISTEKINPISSSLPEILKAIETLPPQDLDLLTEEWSSISLALGALNISSAATASVMTSRIPNLQSPEQFTSSMFFFLSAIKAPNPSRTWVGPDVSTKLRQIGASKIINKMDHDFTRISRLTAETPVGEWRPHLIPMQNGPDISAIPMVTKQIVDEDQNKDNQDDKEKNNNIKVKATRFILELNFSQFGKFLVDGLLKDKRLDLIIKSTNPIPNTIKLNLTEQYNQALQNNGFEGEIIIHDEAESDISVKRMVEHLIHNNTVEENI